MTTTSERLAALSRIDDEMQEFRQMMHVAAIHAAEGRAAHFSDNADAIARVLRRAADKADAAANLT